MEKGKSFVNRLNEVFLNGRWVANTNIKQLIESLSWKQATQKIGDHNSIAELTFHINYYIGGVLNVFQGGKLEIRDKYSFDMSPIESKEDWQNLVKDYLSNANKFIEAVGLMKEEAFDEVFANEKYGTYGRNIEGIIEHSYYHLGQISLIKKLILTNN